MDSSSGLAYRDVVTYTNVSLAFLANLTQALFVIEDDIALAIRFEESFLKPSMIKVALSTLFFGLFTVLAAVAAYILFSKEVKRMATAIMLLAIVLMWTSSVAYWIVTLVAAAEAYTDVRNLTWGSRGLMDEVMSQCMVPLTEGLYDMPERCQPDWGIQRYSFKADNIHDCIGTAAMTVNVIIGDSVVWWRAWVLWPNNRVVHSTCVFMILLTAITGIIDTSDACHVQAFPANPSVITPVTVSATISDTSGTMFSGDPWGIAAGLSSLLTNIIATTLIAYRAWEHRRIIMTYLKGSSQRMQVGRTLALLIECGLLYCALWVFIVSYELTFMSPVLVDSAFQNVFYYVMQACTVPLIGMYPTLVIIVCAVEKSLHEKSSKEHSAGNLSIMFASGLPSRPRGTLSELVGATSVYSAEDAGPLPEDSKDL